MDIIEQVEKKLQKTPVLWNQPFRHNLLKSSGPHNSIGRNVWNRIQRPRDNESEQSLFTESYLNERQLLEDTKTQVQILRSITEDKTTTKTLPPLIPLHKSTNNIQTFYFKVGRDATLTACGPDDLWLVMIVFFVSGSIGVTYRMPRDIDFHDNDGNPTSRGFDVNVLRRNMQIVTDVLYNIPATANISNQGTFLHAYKSAKRKYIREIKRKLR